MTFPIHFFFILVFQSPLRTMVLFNSKGYSLKVVTAGVQVTKWKIQQKFLGSYPYPLAIIFVWELSSNSLEHLMFNLISQILLEKFIDQKKVKVKEQKYFEKIFLDAKLNNKYKWWFNISPSLIFIHSPFHSTLTEILLFLYPHTKGKTPRFFPEGSSHFQL